MLEKIKNSYIIFLSFILLSSSCNNLSDPDNSLTVEEYKNLGMPDYSKSWTLKDYQDAYNTLDLIKLKKPLSLPRKDSKISGPYFARMTDTDNLSFIYDESLTLNERAYKIQEYINVQGSLINVYTDLDNTAQYYNRELIDLYMFGLSISQYMLDLGLRINESIEENDILMQDRFNSIKNFYITMVLFILDNQKKTSLFEERDLLTLTDFLYNSISVNQTWLEPAAIEDIKQSVLLVIENSESEQIKNKYNILVEDL